MHYIDNQLNKPLGQIFCNLLDREEQFNNIIKNTIDKYKVNTITNKTYKIDIYIINLMILLNNIHANSIKLFTLIFIYLQHKYMF